MDPDHEARLKAEARAYALSSTTSKGSKRKLPSGNGGITASYKPLSSAVAQNRFEQPPTKIRKISLAATEALPSQSTTAQGHAIISVFNETDDDYIKFVKSLGLDDSSLVGGSLDNDEEDEFHLSDDEEDDEDDDEDDDVDALLPQEVSHSIMPNEAGQGLTQSLTSSPMSLPDFEIDIYKSLEEELGSLLEEDMEAAVHSLIPSKKSAVPSPLNAATQLSPNTLKPSFGKSSLSPSNLKALSPSTPLRETARHGTKTQVTYHQSQQLRSLLTGHYQLLVQQAVLAVRAAHTQKLNRDKSDFLSGETADDLAEILDGAVGMLQDLDENRKDAIRNSIQLSSSRGAKRSLLAKFKEDDHIAEKDRRLTRAAFTKKLELNSQYNGKRTAFDIPGLMRLKDTFAMIDKSVEGIKGNGNILDSPSHREACTMVLRQASAAVDDSYLCGVLPLTDNFSDAKEILDGDFEPPLTEEQEAHVRRTKGIFTSAEDNLVLRGVNLYGEKQWILIADRYLPDRSVNSISQRYSKLCLLLYKAHGIQIDPKGNLEKPPKLESVDDIDEEKVRALKLTTVEPPAILNVHRWSFEEDLTLLKAVPLMGHMWAELGARLMPHRDRGHLRKRYQVLERRVKATVARSARSDSSTQKSRGIGSSIGSDPKSSNHRSIPSNSLPVSVTGDPQMSIEKAAASLAFLRPPLTQPAHVLNAGSAQTTKPQCSPTSKREIVRLQRKAAPVSRPGLPSNETCSTKPTNQANLPIGESTSSAPVQPSRLPKYANIADKSKLEGYLQDTTSRAAFERLVEGTSDEWSQMSRMKRMLENEDESQAADAIVTHLAKSPGPRKGLSRDDHTESYSTSVFSQLQLEASKQESAATEKAGSLATSSILSRVLGGTAKGQYKQSDIETSDIRSSSSYRKHGGESLSESQKKRQSKENALPGQPPMTPNKPNFFTTAGTPIGFSPGFRSSPGPSRAGFALTPNPIYSPAPNSVMRLMSEPSGDELRFSAFNIHDEASRAKLDDPMELAHDPNPPPFSSPNKNSLNIQEFDAIEAISALNSLSNSPFTAPQPTGTSDEGGRERKQSLFASVIGGVKEKDPKAKLEF